MLAMLRCWCTYCTGASISAIAGFLGDVVGVFFCGLCCAHCYFCHFCVGPSSYHGLAGSCIPAAAVDVPGVSAVVIVFTAVDVSYATCVSNNPGSLMLLMPLM